MAYKEDEKTLAADIKVSLADAFERQSSRSIPPTYPEGQMFSATGGPSADSA